MKKKYSLVLDLGGTNTVAAMFDREGSMIGKKAMATVPVSGPDDFLRRAGSLILGMLEKKGSSIKDIEGFCMGSPGPLDTKKGIMLYSANFKGWKNVNFKKYFTGLLGTECIFENDVNLAGLGEFERELKGKFNNAVILFIGTGLGGVYIEDSRILRGKSGFACEFGHINIEPNGLPCGCGSKGCLESYVSAYGIGKRLKKLHEHSAKWRFFVDSLPERTPKGLYGKAVKGDKMALEFFRETGLYLGSGLKTLINTFNPDVIALGGGVGKALRFILPSAKEYLKKNVTRAFLDDVKIVRARFLSDAALYGGYLLLKNGN